MARGFFAKVTLIIELLTDILTGKLGRLPQVGSILALVMMWIDNTQRIGGPGSRDIIDLKATGVPDQALIAAPVALAFGGMFAVKNAIQAVYETILQKYTRAQAVRLRLAILSPGETVAAVIQSYWRPEKGVGNLAQYGYTDEDAGTLINISGEPLAPGQLLDLLNRGDVDEEFVRQGLNESRLKPKYNDALLKLRFNLLGASDYIRFAVREVFSPAQRQELTLDEGYPTILTEKLRKIGYSEVDARDSWAAHWELPSPTQVYEMLQRGKLPKGVTIEEYLKSADYAPVWRQSLVDISYNPITRTDAKRIYKLRGDLDLLIQNFRNNGYNDEDARALADFTREDVSLETRQERELLVGPVKTSALAMYKARRITEGQLRQTLANLKYPTDIVDRFIADIEYVRETDHREDVANALKASYVKALRSRDDTIAILVQTGYSQGELDQLLETWDLLRQATELQPHQAAQRDLTKAEIIEAYLDGIWDVDQTRVHIVALGYDEVESDAIISLAVFKKRKQELTDNVEVLHQQFLSGDIYADAVSIELDALQVPVNRKRAYLLKWKQELAKRIPDFTIAQLEAMVKEKVMPELTADGYLEAQGYLPQQRVFLLDLWRGKRAAGEAKTLTKLRPGGGVALSRRDYETMYYTNPALRSQVVAGLKRIGYNDEGIAFILDQQDKAREFVKH